MLQSFFASLARAQRICRPSAQQARLIVLTDLSNEPDDEESFVRLLVYSDQFDIEGLIATTSAWLRRNPREDIIRRDLAAYAQVYTNLVKHSAAFPPVEKLLAVTRTGQTNYGMAAVGQGKSTGGSQQIIEAVDRADDRPVWVSVWGGPNTLAQALWDVRASRSTAEVEKFVAKLRVYAISDQDDSGPWLRREFTNLFYIVSPSIRPATWNTIAPQGTASPADAVSTPSPATTSTWWTTRGWRPTSSRTMARLAPFIRGSCTSWKATRRASWG
jgi:hypothetical protein